MSRGIARAPGAPRLVPRAALTPGQHEHRGLSSLVRLTLLGVLIAGLLAMHQLPLGDDCCGGAVPAPSSAVGQSPDQPMSRAAALSTRPSTLASAAKTGGMDEHGLVQDVLGMCLAMLVAAGALLVLSLVKRVRAAFDRRATRPAALLCAAPSRGPPLPRRLAQLQVLRL